MNDKDTVVVPREAQADAVISVIERRIALYRSKRNRHDPSGEDSLNDHGKVTHTIEALHMLLGEMRTTLAAAPSTSVREEDARVAALVGEIEAGRFDALEVGADQWIESAGVKRMANAIASVFEKHAPQDIMDRFRQKIVALMHLAFVEGAAQGVLQLRDSAALKPSTDKGGEE